MLYFTGLFVAFIKKRGFILKFSPYGLLGSAVLSLCMQLTLLSLCLPCFLTHVFHVLFWGLCFYQYYSMASISSALLATAIVFPLIHFNFLPTHLDFKQLPPGSLGANGYVLNVVQSGCPFCQYSLRYFNEFAKEHESQGVKCILVSVSMDEETKREFKRLAPNVEIIPYDSSLLFPYCVIDGYPFFIFADKRGRVVNSLLGVPDDIDRYLNNQMNILLE